MKPIIILPPKTMSDEDIKQLRANDLCVVVAEDPARVKFVDPIPATSSRTRMEDAAISLSRIILNGQWGNYTSSGAISRGDATSIYVDLLVEGTPLAPNYRSPQQVFDLAKHEELQRLAREEAKAERAAAKAKATTKP